MRLLTGCALLLTLVVCVSFAAGLEGNWSFLFSTEDGERPATASFRVEDQAVSGKLLNVDVKGTFSGNRLELSFPFNYEAENLKGELRIAGTLDGDTIVGRWEFAGNSGTFRARRAQ